MSTPTITELDTRAIAAYRALETAIMARSPANRHHLVAAFTEADTAAQHARAEAGLPRLNYLTPLLSGSV